MTARATALVVADHARDVDDARLLLTMLGLLDEHGQLLADDPDELSGHGRLGHDVVLHERVPTTTVPAALRSPPPDPAPARRRPPAARPLNGGGGSADDQLAEPAPDPAEDMPMSAAPDQQPDSHTLVVGALVREARASVALDGETHVVEDFDLLSVSTPAGITVDVGEVVSDQVDDVAEPAPEVVHRARPTDVLAVGLAHRDPAVVAAAQIARLAIDRLITQLQRSTPPPNRR